ncbi:MAG: sensor histidine kinase [Arcobacter sp.]|uniref:sensor histidine kinase n=1 Tax=Arcobacter sp. TaxID=1872629 RepID=UPI003B005C61
MKERFSKVLDYFDKLSFAYKTYFLIFIIAGGMVCIVLLSQVSIFTVKEDFDRFFNKRTKSLIKLENIKDTYKVNIQDTLKDFNTENLSYEQGREVISLGKQIIRKNWELYKKEMAFDNDEIITSFIKEFIINKSKNDDNEILKDNIIKNIDTKMIAIESALNSIKNEPDENQLTKLNLQINAISIYLTSLINYDLSIAINEKSDTQKVFNTIIIFSIISIFLVFLFSIVLSIFITNNFKKLHDSLEKNVDEKTKELTLLNNSLEKKISKEVLQNRKKDIIMFQQARFASLGEMLNNIAHQWRQPLGSITMIVQSFQTKMQLGKLTNEFVDEKVNDALLLASNMSNTLDDFKNFFSPDKTKIKFDIQSCIVHTIELSKYLLTKENIKIELLVKDKITINSYYNELSHVFLNIISNSKDALCSNIDKNDRIIKIIVSKHKNNAIINMMDNGGGIPQEIVPKIFEPYYTTKYKSAGTGIGLYMSKQIIEKHINGSIIYKNVMHKIKDNKNYSCSLFTIKIPINDGEINE